MLIFDFVTKRRIVLTIKNTVLKVSGVRNSLTGVGKNARIEMIRFDHRVFDCQGFFSSV